MFNIKDLQLNKFIAIDVETTGLDLFNDKIIEISAVKFENGRIEERFSKLINPNKKIPYFIENLTGISNLDVSNKSNFSDISDEFIRFIEEYPMVGHNIKFDIDFINKELNRQNDLHSNKFICDTYYLSQIFLYNSHSYKLQSLCNDFSIDINRSHRAEDDARVTGKLFLKILEKISNYNLNDFKDIYKVYSEEMIINRKLFENCIKYFIDNTNIENNQKYEKNNFSVFNSQIKENFSNSNIENIFCDGGILSKKVKEYQFRKSQMQFSKYVEESINDDSILIAEAETGLGKTYGYLIPSLLNKDKKIVISTSTHNLQEQIFDKDLPEIAEILDTPIKCTIIKGMKNYVCKSRLYHLVCNINVLTNSERLDLLPIIFWANYTKTGDISECSGFKIWKNKKIWDLICYDHEFCGYNKAGNHCECFYQSLKNNADNSNLLIINHSLLASCFQKQDSIVDNCDICIIDEAHKLSENCRLQMKETLNTSILKGMFDSYNFIITKILNNNVNHKEFNAVYKNSKNIIKEFSLFLDNFKNMSFSFSGLISSENNMYNNIQDIRYKCSEQTLIDVNPHFDIINEDYQRLIKLLTDNNNVINNLKFDNYTNLEKIDLTIALNKLVDFSLILENMFSDKENYVNWISVRSNNGNVNAVSFNTSPLWVHDIFSELSSKFNSLILTSATLTVDDSFDYILQEIGLNNYLINKKVVMKKFDSPFFIEDQIKLFINDSNDNVNSIKFIESTYKIIKNLKDSLNKRMLVLCTSYKQISSFKDLSDEDTMLFQDMNSSKQILLDKYLKSKNSVLFGTSSFWEGVDLPDEKLEVLFIVKLPFSNPYNPIVQAKIETYLGKNLDPFMDYQLSESILKLRQGIGRLIRRQDDRGVCILADPRILKKRYGENIVDSLPVNYTSYKDYETILDVTENFLGI